jgi:hypothetical protein
LGAAPERVAARGHNFAPARAKKKEKSMGDGITTVRVSAAFYRVLTRVAREPLRVRLATCVVAKSIEHEGARRLVLEIGDDASEQYVRLLDIARSVQTAVEIEERKVGNVAAIRPLVRPPIELPGAPRITVTCVGSTRYFTREGDAKPVAAAAQDVEAGARVHVQLELVGLRRDGESVWHYDVVATQVLVARERAREPEPCLFVDAGETEDWETESVAPESEHPMLSAALADDEAPVSVPREKKTGA